METNRRRSSGIPIFDMSSSDEESSINLLENVRNGLDAQPKTRPNLFAVLPKPSPKYSLRPSIVARARLEAKKRFISSTPLHRNVNNNAPGFGSTDEDGNMSPIVNGVDERQRTMTEMLSNTVSDNSRIESDASLTRRQNKSMEKCGKSKEISGTTTNKTLVNKTRTFQGEVTNKSVQIQTSNERSPKEKRLENVLRRLTTLQANNSQNSYSIHLDENCAEWKGIKRIHKHRNRTEPGLNNKSIQTSLMKSNGNEQKEVENDKELEIDFNAINNVADKLKVINANCLTFNRKEHLAKQYHIECENETDSEASALPSNYSDSNGSVQSHSSSRSLDIAQSPALDNVNVPQSQPWRLMDCMPTDYIAVNRIVEPSVVDFTRNQDKTPMNVTNRKTVNETLKNSVGIASVSPTKRRKQLDESPSTPKRRVPTPKKTSKSLEKSLEPSSSPGQEKERSGKRSDLVVVLFNERIPNEQNVDKTITNKSIRDNSIGVVESGPEVGEQRVNVAASMACSLMVNETSNVSSTLTPKNNKNNISKQEVRRDKSLVEKSQTKKKAQRKVNNKQSEAKQNGERTSNRIKEKEALEEPGIRRSTRERKPIKHPFIRLSKATYSEVNKISASILSSKLTSIKEHISHNKIKQIEESAWSDAVSRLMTGKILKEPISEPVKETKMKKGKGKKGKKMVEEGKERETEGNVNVTQEPIAETSGKEEIFKEPTEPIKKPVKKRGKRKENENAPAGRIEMENGENVTQEQMPTDKKDKKQRNRKKQQNNSDGTLQEIQNRQEDNVPNEIMDIGQESMSNESLSPKKWNQSKRADRELSVRLRSSRQNTEKSTTQTDNEIVNEEVMEPLTIVHDYIPENLNIEVSNRETITSQVDNETELTQSRRNRKRTTNSEEKPKRTRTRASKRKENVTRETEANGTQNVIESVSEMQPVDDNVVQNSETESTQEMRRSFNLPGTRKVVQKRKSGRIEKNYRHNSITSMEVVSAANFDEVAHSLHIKWRGSRNFHKFATSKPHFTQIANGQGQIGVTVKSLNTHGVMGYFIINPDSSISYEADKTDKFCTIMEGEAKLVTNEKNFELKKLSDFIIERDHSFTISNLNKEKSLVVHFVQHS